MAKIDGLYDVSMSQLHQYRLFPLEMSELGGWEDLGYVGCLADTHPVDAKSNQRYSYDSESEKMGVSFSSGIEGGPSCCWGLSWVTSIFPSKYIMNILITYSNLLMTH